METKSNVQEVEPVSLFDAMRSVHLPSDLYADGSTHPETDAYTLGVNNTIKMAEDWFKVNNIKCPAPPASK